MHPFDSIGSTSFQTRVGAPLNAALERRQSVALIGMKRVGINAFVRQYLQEKSYHSESKSLSITVDLNSLFERSIYAFWILTLKMILDTVHSSVLDDEMREKSDILFAQSIQLRDTFFTMHAVQRLLSYLTDAGYTVTLFFLRFDRLQSVITNEFYSNLQGLKDTTPRLAYVVTSFRPLDELVPEVFKPSSVPGFFQEQYVPPLNAGEQTDFLKNLFQSYQLRYSFDAAQEIERLCGGHVQYLHLSVLRLKASPEALATPHKIESVLKADENIAFLSEEILKSLMPAEQQVLKRLPVDLEACPRYLLDTGVVTSTGNVFSPLFALGMKDRSQSRTQLAREFTKKEQVFFDVLHENLGGLVERNTLIESVWPEESELGVSDWAVDRLAARVRRKLITQQSPYKIQTVVSRGYKLLSIEETQSAGDESPHEKL